MRSPLLNVFKKSVIPKAVSAPTQHGPKSSMSETSIKWMPSWWIVILAYALAALFCYGTYKFFIWFPPYFQEVFKNLRGLPVTWADIGLLWAKRGLWWIAILAAVYHHLWQMSTRYQLTSHDIYIESWFPFRRVIATPYASVRRIGFQQTFLGLIFNYGHIEIDTGSPSGPLVLINCPRPKKFMEILQGKVEKVIQPQYPSALRSMDSL